MNSNMFELKNLIDGFRLSCKTEGKSPKTIEWYISFVTRFRRFLELNNLSCQIDNIHKNHVKLFILYLQEEARTPRSGKILSSATVQGYVRSLRVFFAWAYREDYILSNPLCKLLLPKVQSKVINTFTSDQIYSLLHLCQISNGNGQRNLTILLLLLDTGIRVSELVNIELNDINLSEGFIKIRIAKCGKERIVPIGSLVQKSMWKYINSYRPQPLTQQITSLFLSDKGLPLTKSGIQQMLRRYGRKAGLHSVRCSPHTFRHTFAKNYLLNGGDIFSLQKILGHSSLASVRVYLNLFSTDIQKQHQRFSPVDNLAQALNFYRISSQLKGHNPAGN